MSSTVTSGELSGGTTRRLPGHLPGVTLGLAKSSRTALRG
jgi:hypothetical protein